MIRARAGGQREAPAHRAGCSEREMQKVQKSVQSRIVPPRGRGPLSRVLLVLAAQGEAGAGGLGVPAKMKRGVEERNQR